MNKITGLLFVAPLLLICSFTTLQASDAGTDPNQAAPLPHTSPPSLWRVRIGCQSAEGDLLAGRSRMDLNAPIGAPIIGYPERLATGAAPADDPFNYSTWYQPAQGSHDRLFARGLALQVEDDLFILVALDLFATSGAFHDDLFRAIEDLGIAQTNLLVTATNTFAGPGAMNVDPFYQFNLMDQYQAMVYERILEAAEEAARAAVADLQPAEWGYASAVLPNVTYNNRGGVVDDQLTVMKLVDEGGSTIALAFNFAAKGACLGYVNRLYSADCLGAAARRIERDHGDDLVVIGLNGAQGDSSPVATGFDGLDETSGAIADQINQLINQIPTSNQVTMRTAARVLQLPEPYLRPHFFDEQWPPEVTIPLTGQAHTTTRLHALRINEMVAISVPGEPVASYGLQLKQVAAQFPEFEQLIPIGLGLDYIGPIMPEDDYWQGGYEAAMCIFGPEAHDLLIEASGELALAVANPTATPTPALSPTPSPTPSPAPSTPTMAPTSSPPVTTTPPPATPWPSPTQTLGQSGNRNE